MHDANMRFWERLKALEPEHFTDARVLEVGSRDENGTVRMLFEGGTYIGVDWREGPGVDVVSLAHEMQVPGPFDTVISSSLLEHDPFWEQSLAAMVAELAPTGSLLLSWGAARNHTHNEDHAPDGLFHPLPAGRVLRLLEGLGLRIRWALYERDIWDVYGDTGRGDGEFCLVAAMPDAARQDVAYVTALLEEDEP